METAGLGGGSRESGPVPAPGIDQVGVGYTLPHRPSLSRSFLMLFTRSLQECAPLLRFVRLELLGSSLLILARLGRNRSDLLEPRIVIEISFCKVVVVGEGPPTLVFFCFLRVASSLQNLCLQGQSY